MIRPYPPITPARDKKYTSPQAVMERVCDEKSGERRGDQLQMTTLRPRVFVRFLQRKFLRRRNLTKLVLTSSKRNWNVTTLE
jgi:hypothetical protein